MSKKYIPSANLAILFFLLLASCQKQSSGKIENSTQESVNIATLTPAPAQQTPSIIGKQTVNGVTITIDWVLADAKRVSFGYTIEGLPDVPDATDLFGNIQLVEKSGIGKLGGNGDSKIERAKDSPGTLVGSWSSVFAIPFTQRKGNFGLDIILGDDKEVYDTNFTIASFPFPVNATPYPPNMFPPKLPDHKVGDFHFDFETEIFPLLSLTPNQSVTANQINMRLEKLEITASFTAATLCYSKPSPSDWGVSRATLKVGSQETLNTSYSLVFDSDYGGYQGVLPQPKDSPQIRGGRCVQLEFLSGHGNQSGSVTLIIPSLEQSMPESIPDTELAVAREKLLSQGIDIDWKVESSSGHGGGAGPVYNKLPDGMTQAEAYQRFIEALGYIHRGSWEFTVNINP